MKTIEGLHHVTAIAGNPQRNVAFYTGVLGLRLVKKTVNFDDPNSYHFYYGNEQGEPGTLLTFFSWPEIARGRRGSGQVTAFSFAIPEGSAGFWLDRLRSHQVTADRAPDRFEEEAILFLDPDGLQIELVVTADAGLRPPWNDGPVSEAQAIRGLHSITASEEGYESTAELLTETLGFQLVREHANRFRYSVGGGGSGAMIDLLCVPSSPPGVVAIGAVHHAAWRTPDDAQQKQWRQALVGKGLNVSPVMDREYFHSIYFREPGGVLFEIATDPPGFTIDEPLAELGSHLKLPPWYEPYRAELERVLPPVTPAYVLRSA